LFLRLLGKKKRDLTTEEEIASQYYWELCIQPFIWRDTKEDTIYDRIKAHLANPPNMETVYAGVRRFLMDTDSPAWKTLADLGIGDKIWDSHRKHLQLICDGSADEDDRIAVYDQSDVG
jgi:hypothetical protein